jgi:uncharacterized LabA/DUF88 family protein
VDGQNLYHCVRETFGYSFPNYDVLRLAQHVCTARGWMLSEVRFYTGFPDAQDDAMWNGFWSRKLLAIKRQGVYVYSRPLRYRNRVIKLSGGATLTTRVGEEKGIDVRIAIDLIRLAHRQRYDVAVVFSQDQDLSEVADAGDCQGAAPLDQDGVRFPVRSEWPERARHQQYRLGQDGPCGVRQLHRHLRLSEVAAIPYTTVKTMIRDEAELKATREWVTSLDYLAEGTPPSVSR